MCNIVHMENEKSTFRRNAELVTNMEAIEAEQRKREAGAGAPEKETETILVVDESENP